MRLDRCGLADAALQSIRLIADACDSFRTNCVDGLAADEQRIAALVSKSLMLVTALTPVIGYDKAAKIAKQAHHNGTTLREEALALGYVDAATFDKAMNIADMTAPRRPQGD